MEVSKQPEFKDYFRRIALYISAIYNNNNCLIVWEVVRLCTLKFKVKLNPFFLILLLATQLVGCFDSNIVWEAISNVGDSTNPTTSISPPDTSPLQKCYYTLDGVKISSTLIIEKNTSYLLVPKCSNPSPDWFDVKYVTYISGVSYNPTQGDLYIQVQSDWKSDTYPNSYDFTITPSLNGTTYEPITLTISILPTKPEGLAYTYPRVILSKNQVILPNTPEENATIFSNAPEDLKYVAQTALPQGLTLDALTGKLKGTPTVETSGDCGQNQFTIVAYNRVDSSRLSSTSLCILVKSELQHIASIYGTESETWGINGSSAPIPFQFNGINALDTGLNGGGLFLNSDATTLVISDWHNNRAVIYNVDSTNSFVGFYGAYSGSIISKITTATQPMPLSTSYPHAFPNPLADIAVGTFSTDVLLIANNNKLKLSAINASSGTSMPVPIPQAIARLGSEVTDSTSLKSLFYMPAALDSTIMKFDFNEFVAQTPTAANTYLNPYDTLFSFANSNTPGGSVFHFFGIQSASGAQFVFNNVDGSNLSSTSLPMAYSTPIPPMATTIDELGRVYFVKNNILALYTSGVDGVLQQLKTFDLSDFGLSNNRSYNKPYLVARKGHIFLSKATAAVSSVERFSLRPPAPAGLSFVPISAGTCQLSWPYVSAATQYKVVCYDSVEGAITSTNFPIYTNHTTNMQVNNYYTNRMQCSIYSINSFGISEASNPIVCP